MKTVIMAGGRGTRIATHSSKVPKPMIPVLNKPVLEYQIECLREQGYGDIIIVTGYLGDVVQNYFGNGNKISPATGRQFGISINYVKETIPLGTAGSLYLLQQELTDDFLLLNGDVIFDVDISRFYNYHKSKRSIATIMTHANNHPYDSGIVIANNDGQIQNWIHKEDQKLWYKNNANLGLHLLAPKIFSVFDKPKRMDMDRDVLQPLIPSGRLYAYDSPEYVQDMGTPERLYAVTRDIENGIVRSKKLVYKQKAIFMFRDGTINITTTPFNNVDDFKLLKGAAEAIKRINKNGYLAIVVNNQPLIGAEQVSMEKLGEINNKMETLLGKQEAYLDDILCCPLQPHEGSMTREYEYNLSYKTHCKSIHTMLNLEAEKYNIDLTKSLMISCCENDIMIAKNVGCQFALLGKSKMVKNICSFKNLNECIETFLS